MEIILSNSEYNFIKNNLKKNLDDIFTLNFKEFLKNEINLSKYNDIPNIDNRVLKMKSILNKLNKIKGK